MGEKFRIPSSDFVVEVLENTFEWDPRKAIEEIGKLAGEVPVLHSLLGDIVVHIVESTQKNVPAGWVEEAVGARAVLKFRVWEDEHGTPKNYTIAVTKYGTVIYADGDGVALFDASEITAELIAKGLFYYTVTGGW